MHNLGELQSNGKTKPFSLSGMLFALINRVSANICLMIFWSRSSLTSYYPNTTYQNFHRHQQTYGTLRQYALVLKARAAHWHYSWFDHLLRTYQSAGERVRTRVQKAPKTLRILGQKAGKDGMQKIRHRSVREPGRSRSRGRSTTRPAFVTPDTPN